MYNLRKCLKKVTTALLWLTQPEEFSLILVLDDNVDFSGADNFNLSTSTLTGLFFDLQPDSGYYQKIVIINKKNVYGLGID